MIVMGHGSGGRMSHDLITRTFLPSFDNEILRRSNDAGIVNPRFSSPNQKLDYCKLAISTDSHVVWPLFFAGGDIGRLAVCGTVNDVAMMGAEPLYLTAGFILEEGLEFEILERIIHSMGAAAKEADIQIVAGDTKVVQNGKADGIYINTAGIGILPENLNIDGSCAQPGDIVIVSGTLGDHGIAVLEARGELGFQSGISSDIAPLNNMVKNILKSGADVHVLRDPTRGGLATSLTEIASQSHVGIEIEEEKIPVQPAVNAACEMLGFDPLYIANEGKLMAIVAESSAEKALKAMRNSRYGKDAVAIGKVIDKPSDRVLMKTLLGSTRVIEMLSGEMLPRIC
jgi:hydrogenase expression/formation protein HypE